MRELKNFYSPNILLLFLWAIFIFLFLLLLSMNSFSKQPQVCNLSQANFFFIGREDQLKMIDSFFKKGDKIVLALTGGPGFGKSQIAKKYAHASHTNYDLIWWIDAQQDIPSQFEKLALALNTLLPETEQILPTKLSKEALLDMVKNQLRLKNIRYLLIFDNPETYAQVEKFIPIVHYPSDKHVLLTSRNASIWPDKIEVGKFKREESLCMIKGTIPQEKKEDMIRLADTLSDYPLELYLAISFIKSHPTVTLDKYIAMYLKRPLKVKKATPNVLLDNYPTNSLGSIEISLKFIEEESKDSLHALFFMSLLNSKDIPESYIELWLKKAKSSITADDAIKHVYDQSLLGVSETTEFNANKKPTGHLRMYYLSIHDLIHQLINEQIDIETKKELIDKATEVMLEVFSGTSEVFIKKVVQEPIHLLHAQKLCENAKAIGHSNPKLLKLKVCIFECFMGPLRDCEAAKPYLKSIEEDLKAGIVLEPYYRALFNINKGFFEAIHNVNYDEAIQYMSEGLSILEALGGYPEERLRALTNLAQEYNLKGQLTIAEKFINKGQPIFKQSKSEIYNSLFIYACSSVLNDQGKFKESIDILNKAKAYSTLSTEYPTMEHSILYQKAEAFIKQGELKKAWKILAECEKQLNEYFQNRKTTSLANVFVFKSLILISQKKKMDGVFQYLTEALQIYEKSYQGKKKHSNQGRAHLAMGKAYKAQNDFQNALTQYLLSEKVYNSVLAEKKIYDVSDLYTELAILGTKLKDDGITHKYLTAHIETFGIDHPRTEKILNHLDLLKLAVPN